MSAGKNVGPLGRAASALKVIHFSKLCGVLLTPFSEGLGTLTRRKMAIQGYSAENSKTWSQGLGERFGSDRAYPAAGDFDGRRGPTVALLCPLLRTGLCFFPGA